MKPLSREASAALGAMKATEPSAADEARVRQGLERTLGIAVPTATLAIAASAQAATGLAALSLGAKTLIVIAAVSATTVVGVVTLASRGTEAPAPQQVSAPEPVLAPPPFEPPPVEPAPEPVAAPPPPAHVARPKPVPVVEVPAVKEEPQPESVAAPPPPPPPEPATEATAEAEIETNFPGCDADTELRCAQSARQLLNADRAQEAVWLLGSYQRRCPSGRWSDEAWAVRMAGLCKLGRHAEVIGLLQWFSTEYPQRRAAVTADLQSSCPAEVLVRKNE